jgi:hypothetical protein
MTATSASRSSMALAAASTCVPVVLTSSIRATRARLGAYPSTCDIVP